MSNDNDYMEKLAENYDLENMTEEEIQKIIDRDEAKEEMQMDAQKEDEVLQEQDKEI